MPLPQRLFLIPGICGRESCRLCELIRRISSSAIKNSKGSGRATNRWPGWEPFFGTWQGTETGALGQAEGEFSFQPELQGAVLVRHSYAEYPASKDKPAYRHDDLMVIYSNDDGKKTRADYWDNEGMSFTTRFDMPAGRLVFASVPEEGGPRYLLSYVKTSDDA